MQSLVFYLSCVFPLIEEPMNAVYCRGQSRMPRFLMPPYEAIKEDSQLTVLNDLNSWRELLRPIIKLSPEA